MKEKSVGTRYLKAEGPLYPVGQGCLCHRQESRQLFTASFRLYSVIKPPYFVNILRNVISIPQNQEGFQRHGEAVTYVRVQTPAHIMHVYTGRQHSSTVQDSAQDILLTTAGLLLTWMGSLSSDRGLTVLSLLTQLAS